MSQSSEMATPQKKFPYIDVFEEKVSGAMFLDEECNPMYFVICIRDYELKSELKNFIEYCGGQVNESIQEMNPYAAVLVADNCLCWSHNGDVFRLSYIESCFNERRCLDISDFRRNSESPVKPGFNYMNIIYYKKYPWNEIPSEFLKVPSKNASKGNQIYTNTVTQESEDNCSSNEIEPTIGNMNTRNKNTRWLYSMEEKTAILEYITTNQEYDRIKGTILWKIMEKKQVCKVRTWQSMKEHFMKKIMSELSLYKFLTPDQLKKLKYNYVK